MIVISPSVISYLHAESGCIFDKDYTWEVTGCYQLDRKDEYICCKKKRGRKEQDAREVCKGRCGWRGRMWQLPCAIASASASLTSTGRLARPPDLEQQDQDMSRHDQEDRPT